ncbi:GerAB/ArcD/ProY family transporter [Paenibacillus phocaensis]|uniref:GerAB/ArcD/ProY family transporter n=1 Tax=Paenibacillus phocaensis TaxID=1776378 RepID=UPI000839C6DA|nr:endospore germination permease [Paenibacillus phocaensis]
MRPKSVSPRQLFILTFGLTVGTSILVTPAGLTHMAREDAWLASLISLFVNLVMIVLYIVLARLYPGKTLFEINEACLGKWLGKLISLLYLFYFLILTGTLLGNLSFFLSSELIPETPTEATQILFLAAAVMCARLGAIILARFGELVFPWVMILFLILILALVPQVDWNHIQPIMEDGFLPVARAGVHSAMFQELVVLLAFLPLVKEKKGREAALLGGTLLGGLVLAVIVLFGVLVLGIEQAENATFPTFALAKTINVGNFFQRVEVILITIWILTFFIKIALLFHAILVGLRSVFGLRDPRMLILPLAVLFMLVAWHTYINTVYVADIIQRVWAGYAMMYLLLVPLVLWLIGYVRSRIGKEG